MIQNIEPEIRMCCAATQAAPALWEGARLGSRCPRHSHPRLGSKGSQLCGSSLLGVVPEAFKNVEQRHTGLRMIEARPQRLVAGLLGAAGLRCYPPAMTFFIAMLLATAEPSIQAIAEPAGGTVGFAAMELASGRSLGLKRNESFPMQSVFKLPIAIEVLRQVDEGKIDLDHEILLGADDAREGVTTIVLPSRMTVRKLLEAMVVSSDNVACDRLLALVGGPRAVDARMRGLGVEGIAIRFSEREMTAGKGDNTATPAAMVALLVRMARQGLGLLPTSAKYLEDLLLQVGTGAKRIKGALPPGTPVAHKSGTSRTQDGKTDATNDVGLISLPNGNRIAIAVFVHDSPADERTREETIAKLARAVYDTLTTRKHTSPNGRRR